MKTYLAAAMVILFAVSPALGAGSSSVTPTVSKDQEYYNSGVALMYDKKFSEAETNFRKALDENENFAEAHNNLAYVLRKQGSDFFEEALQHYTRAIELKPDLAQPYMYRGVLFVQMGNKEAALQDHEKLLTLDEKLAIELQYVIENGKEKEPEQFFGVSPKQE